MKHDFRKKKKQFSILCLHVKGKTILENDAETYEKETRNYQAFQNIETICYQVKIEYFGGIPKLYSINWRCAFNLKEHYDEYIDHKRHCMPCNIY